MHCLFGGGLRGQDGDVVCIIVSGADRGAFGEMQHQATACDAAAVACSK